MLQPEEEFNIITLSGGLPKLPGKHKFISISLGPMYCTDIVAVETSDHARLNL